MSMQQNNFGNKKFESHASWKTNERIGILFAQADVLAPKAWSTRRISDIQYYFHTVNQIFKNVKDVLSNAEEVNKCKNKYEYLIGLVNSDERFRSLPAIEYLLKLTDEMYSQIVSGMQAWEYFFRVGSYQKKGLKNIRFCDDSIFSGGIENGTGRVDPGSNEPEEDSEEYQGRV